MLWLVSTWSCLVGGGPSILAFVVFLEFLDILKYVSMTMCWVSTELKAVLPVVVQVPFLCNILNIFYLNIDYGLEVEQSLQVKSKSSEYEQINSTPTETFQVTSQPLAGNTSQVTTIIRDTWMAQFNSPPQVSSQKSTLGFHTDAESQTNQQTKATALQFISS